jgi:mono/diheme cytochrome c family protein
MRLNLRHAVVASVLLLLGCDYKPRNQGRVLYEKECQSCHMENGQGLGKLIPPVAKSDYVVKHRDDLACLIRNGIAGEMTVNGQVYTGEMAGNSQLTEIEINNLVHYILVDLNDQKEPFQISEVRAQLERCKQ